jgi:hypothetical protein
VRGVDRSSELFSKEFRGFQVGELLKAYEEEDYVLLCTESGLPVPKGMRIQVVLKVGKALRCLLLRQVL